MQPRGAAARCVGITQEHPMTKSSSVDRLDELRATANDLGASAEAEIAELRAKVEALMAQRVGPLVTKVADGAREVAQDTADAVRRNADSLLDEVRARPLTSLGVAAAVGFMLAHLLRR
jgi:ElaB/YqjD/DUF883 family membrane-anchored ribosome-binding protein